MLQKMTMILIGQAERRLGVGLDYTRQIARTDFGLLRRYNRIFGFLDPNKKVPVQAFHAARLRGAMAADCGTCVEAEINLARAAGLDDGLIDQVLAGRGAQISPRLRQSMCHTYEPNLRRATGPPETANHPHIGRRVPRQRS